MSKLWSGVIGLVFVLSAASSWGQSSEEGAARAAEQAGKLREALTQYVAALRNASEGGAKEQELREKIISLAPRVKPLPAVPDDAERFMVRGKAAVKSAKSATDFRDALSEFKKALRAAPWLANGYYNLGVVQEKLEDYTGAMQSYRLYSLAAPAASDAAAVRRKVIELEYLQEKAQKESVEKKEKAAQKRTEEDAYRRNLGFLAGRWNGTLTTHFERLRPPGSTVRLDIAVDISIDGKEVKVTRVDTRTPEVFLVGRVAGNDYSSIRWEIAAGQAYSPESVAVQVSPSRIYFSLPSRFESQRLDNFIEYELRK